MNGKQFSKKALCLAILGASPIAFAQSNNSGQSEIEQVVVTGTKVERSLQDTPVSVNVTGAETLRDAALFNVYDVLEQVPNVSIDDGTEFSVRGINAFGVSQSTAGGGTNNALASLYVDGAPMPYRMIQQGALTAWDVEQIEVFRGPQSTVQGKNTLAGAVVISTAKPTYDWDAKLRVNAGEYGLREYAFAGGGALIEDQLAFRVVGETSDHDGYNDAPNMPQNSDYSENETWRFKMLYEPNALDGFSAMFSYTNTQSDNGVKFVNVPENPDDLYSERVLDFNSPTREFTDADLYNLKLDYDLNANWSLTSITAYTDADYGYDWDSDASPLDLAQQFDNRNDKTLSQEFRAVFDYDRLSGVVGAYYSDLESADHYTGNQLLPFSSLGIDQLLTYTLMDSFGFDQATALATTDAVMGIYAANGSDPADLGLDGRVKQNIETQALFADLKYDINQYFSLLLGVRIDDETQSFSSTDSYAINSALPDPAAFDPTTGMIIGMLNQQLLATADQASTSIPETEDSFTEVLPKAGITFYQTDDINYSLTYQKGYRSGGVGYNIIRGEAYAFDPEFTDNYELAMRSTWLDGALVLNANLFFIDWTDQQLTIALSAADNDTMTVNAGQSEVSGFEVETNYFVSENLSFSGGVGYSDTEFKEYSSNGNTYDGRPFAGAPEYTANLGANYRSDSGVIANVTVNYTDGSITELKPNGSDVFEPTNDSRTLVNARVGYEWGNDSSLGVFLVAKNLFDEEYRTAAASITNPSSHTLGDPRQLSLELHADF